MNLWYRMTHILPPPRKIGQYIYRPMEWSTTHDGFYAAKYLEYEDRQNPYALDIVFVRIENYGL